MSSHTHLAPPIAAVRRLAAAARRRIGLQDGMTLVQIAILFMTSSPVTPRMTPEPSRCSEARVIWVIQSVVETRVSSLGTPHES